MFTESNTVEQMIPDAAAKLGGKLVSMVREDAPPYRGQVARRCTAPGELGLYLLRSGSAPAYLSQNRARAMFNKG